jgi:hypothetical protein
MAASRLSNPCYSRPGWPVMVLEATRLTLVIDVRSRGFASPPLDGFALFSSAARHTVIGPANSRPESVLRKILTLQVLRQSADTFCGGQLVIARRVAPFGMLDRVNDPRCLHQRGSLLDLQGDNAHRRGGLALRTSEADGETIPSGGAQSKWLVTAFMRLHISVGHPRS